MNEKIYKAMGSSAVSSLVIGICVLATGIAAVHHILLATNSYHASANKTIESRFLQIWESKDFFKISLVLIQFGKFGALICSNQRI